MMTRALSRRHVLGLAPALAVGLAACGADGQERAPRGWHMPLESAPHLRTFMQWPVNLDVYDRRSLGRVQRAIARIANAIADFEPVVMLAAAVHHPAARRLLGDAVELAYEAYVDMAWRATFARQLAPHRPYLCAR